MPRTLHLSHYSDGDLAPVDRTLVLEVLDVVELRGRQMIRTTDGDLECIVDEDDDELATLAIVEPNRDTLLWRAVATLLHDHGFAAHLLGGRIAISDTFDEMMLPEDMVEDLGVVRVPRGGDLAAAVLDGNDGGAPGAPVPYRTR